MTIFLFLKKKEIRPMPLQITTPTKLIVFSAIVVAALIFIASFFYLGYVSTPFDPTDRELACYSARYPELNLGSDISAARQHWFKIGALEGRIPHCPRPFDPDNMPQQLSDDQARQYMDGYTDLQRTFKGDLEAVKKHWMTIGFYEGRVISQAWRNDMPRKLFLLTNTNGLSRQGCKPDAAGKLVCTGGMEAFDVEHLGDDNLALKATTGYCGDSGDGSVFCNNKTIGNGEKFKYQKLGMGKVTLRSGLTEKYCDGTTGPFVCTGPNPVAFDFFQRLPAAANNANIRSKPFPPATTYVPLPPPTPSAPTTTTAPATAPPTVVTPLPAPVPVVSDTYFGYIFNFFRRR